MDTPRVGFWADVFVTSVDKHLKTNTQFLLGYSEKRELCVTDVVVYTCNRICKREPKIVCRAAVWEQAGLHGTDLD